MDILPEFSDDDIKSNTKLFYISKLIEKINYLSGFTTTGIIENGQGYGKKLTYLSNPFNAFGDSYTEGGGTSYSPVWEDVLTTLTGIPNTNLGVGGTCADYMGCTYINSLVLDTAYTNRTSIITYGVNDCNRTPTLYRNYYLYAMCLINNYCLAACPQNKFVACRNFTTKSGVWGNAGVNNVSTYTQTINNYIEHTFTNGRYIFISAMVVSATNQYFKVEVNGEIKGYFIINNAPTVYQSPVSLFQYGILLDLGMVTSSVIVRLTNLTAYAAGVYSIYFNAVCCWNDDDQLLNNRQVLVATAPKHMFLTSPGSDYNDFTDEKRRVINDCIKNAVLTCSRFGLNISCISYSHVNGLYSDNLHPSSFQSAMFAYNIKSIATTL